MDYAEGVEVMLRHPRHTEIVSVMRLMIRAAGSLPAEANDATVGQLVAAWQEACGAEGREDMLVKPEDTLTVALGGFAEGVLLGRSKYKKG